MRAPQPSSARTCADIYNKLAAINDCNVTVTPGGCLYNNDGVTDPEVWAQRRHIAKVHAAAQNFAAVFGPGSINTQVRAVYAEWSIFPQRFNASLAWFNKTFGTPSDYLYAMAGES